MLAFSCLCVSCRWCLASVPAFGRCKVTTSFPSLQAISDLARPCFRPAVQSDCPNVCARSHAYRAERGTLAFPWAWRERKAPPFCYPTGKNLLPSWAAIFLQLGSNATLFYALSVPCVPRSVDAIWGARLLFYLLINRSYIPTLSLHRAREIYWYLLTQNSIVFLL